MADEGSNREALRWQARFCLANDAPVTAAVCDALADRLDRSTATGARVLDWPGEPIADAVPLRLTGGLHALARSGRCAALDPVYRDGITDPVRVWAALGVALAEHDAELVRWLDGPPQTNEPYRSGAFMAALLVLADRYRLPFELFEIGSSAGLNLLIDRYRFVLGGIEAGPADAPLTVAPEWRGPPPPRAEVAIVRVEGVDVAPLRLADDLAAERLTSYVWVDQAERLARTARAIALARAHPPRLAEGDAAAWVEARLAEPQPTGMTRVLMHSIVWQYLSQDGQARIAAAMARAADRATPDRPLAWIAYEGERGLNRHVLTVRSWPRYGEERLLAYAHPHALWIEWVG